MGGNQYKHVANAHAQENNFWDKRREGQLTRVPASGSANSSHLLEACIRNGVINKDKAVTPAAQTGAGSLQLQQHHRKHPECVTFKTHCTLTVIAGLVKGFLGKNPKTRGGGRKGGAGAYP